MSLYPSIGAALLLLSQSVSALPPTKRGDGLCTLQINEVAAGNKGPMASEIIITNKDGVQIFDRNDGPFDYGTTVTISGTDSKLPYDINVHFTKDGPDLGSLLKRGDYAPPVFRQFNFEHYAVKIDAGPTSFSFQDVDPKKAPYSKVGNWDTGSFIEGATNFLSFVMGTKMHPETTPNRKADCHWAC